MLEQIPPGVLNSWIAYYELEPWGPERGDLQAAIQCSTMASLWAKGKFPASDFMPDFTGERNQKPTRDQLRKKLMAFASAHGARLPPKEVALLPVVS